MSASQKLAGFVVAAVLFGFATAPAAQAASLSSTQVEAILSLLQSFGADQSVINNVSVALGGSPATNQTCVDLSSNLTLGSTGSDVTNLQNYLTNKSYFSGAATGYYGYVTAGAVGQLQLSLGVVSSQNDTAYGIMGPRTRAAVGCGNNPVPNPLPAKTISHVLGNANAHVQVMVWSDTECPYCKLVASTVRQLMNHYGASGDVSLAYSPFPLTAIHPNAAKEAEAAECVADQGGNYAYFKYLDLLYTATSTENGLSLAQLPQFAASLGLNVGVFNDCLNADSHTKQIQDSYNAGVAAGITGTPTAVIYVDGVQKQTLAGSQPYSSYVAAIDPYLNKPVAPTASATIDQSSLTSTADNPVITGSANTLAVTIVVSGGATIPNVVRVVDGRWSFPALGFNNPGAKIAAGSYPVTVLDGYNRTLVSGTLTITNGSTSTTPTATIDQSSLTSSSNNPTITGNARNSVQVAVSVLDDDGKVVGVNDHLIGFVSDGKWEVHLINLTPRSYNVLVYDAVTNIKLVQNELTVAQNLSATPTATIDKSSLVVSQDSSGSYHGTITGTATNVSRVMISLPNNSGGAYCVVPSQCSSPVGSNGRWSFNLGGAFPMGINGIEVYDDSSGSVGALLTTGTLTVNSDTSSVTSYTIPAGGFSMGVGNRKSLGALPMQIVMQSDGNFVLYANGGSAPWATNTSGMTSTCGGGNCVAQFQTDGNLVLYASSTPYWASNTSGVGKSMRFSTTAPYVQILDAAGNVVFQ